MQELARRGQLDQRAPDVIVEFAFPPLSFRPRELDNESNGRSVRTLDLQLISEIAPGEEGGDRFVVRVTGQASVRNLGDRAASVGILGSDTMSPEVPDDWPAATGGIALNRLLDGGEAMTDDRQEALNSLDAGGQWRGTSRVLDSGEEATFECTVIILCDATRSRFACSGVYAEPLVASTRDVFLPRFSLSMASLSPDGEYRWHVERTAERYYQAAAGWSRGGPS